VDKKGILSWPNPTAEKIFFLRNGSWGHQQTDFKEETVTLKPSSTAVGAILKKGKDSAKKTRKRSNKRNYAERNYHLITAVFLYLERLQILKNSM
jgi:hypothetical protein